MSPAPRVVVVHRRDELAELVERHGTLGQARFLLGTRGRSIDDVQQRHDRLEAALREVSAAIPADWRRGRVERADLDRFVFEPQDVVVVVGQDGLVANVAKYLDGQVVIGVDPQPGTQLGVLVRHPPRAVAGLLRDVVAGRAPLQQRPMVRAQLDDGQQLDALNEVYVGHPSHQSARYLLHLPGGSERQSSSGVLACSGTGSTGWAASVVRERRSDLALPAASAAAVAWFVREAWPSPVTGTTLTQGLLGPDERLVLSVESDALVVFGDGLEADRLGVGYGERVRLGTSPRVLRLA